MNDRQYQRASDLTSVASTTNFSVHPGEHPKNILYFKSRYDRLIELCHISPAEKLTNEKKVKLKEANDIYRELWDEFTHGSAYAHIFLLQYKIYAKRP